MAPPQQPRRNRSIRMRDLALGDRGLPQRFGRMPGCRRCCDPARIASTSIATSPRNRRTFTLTATICRPNSGSASSNWQATLDFAPTNCARYNRWWRIRVTGFWRHGMSFSASSADERVLDVLFTDDTISVNLRDGRVITVPLVWYPRLLDATAPQRNNWKIAGGGYGIHWPDIDEDLSTEGLLRGAPAPKTSVPAK